MRLERRARAAAAHRCATRLVPLSARWPSGRRPDVSFLAREFPPGGARPRSRARHSVTRLRPAGGREDASRSVHAPRRPDGRAPDDGVVAAIPRGSLDGLIHEVGHGLYEQGTGQGQSPDAHGRGGVVGGARVAVEALGEPGRPRPCLLGTTGCPWPGGSSMRRWPTCRSSDSTPRSTRSEPSLIRVEADEATYNLHIIVRFELELGLLAGRPGGRRRPGAWNDAERARCSAVPGPTRPSRWHGYVRLLERAARLLPDRHAGDLPGELMGGRERLGDGAPPRCGTGDVASVPRWPAYETSTTRASLPGRRRSHGPRPASLLSPSSSIAYLQAKMVSSTTLACPLAGARRRGQMRRCTRWASASASASGASCRPRWSPTATEVTLRGVSD